jgi:hypothetical protein
VRTATPRTRVHLQGFITARWRPRHNTCPAHGTAAHRGVALGPTYARRSTKARSQVQPTPRARGGNGAAAHRERHGSSPVHGETATRRRSAARRHAHRQDQGKGTTQVRARLWFISRWVGDGVVAGLTKKAARCRRSRRRSTPCSAPAPLRRGERYSLSPSTRAASGLGAPAASRRWLPLLRTSSSFPASPALLLSQRRTQDGENPNAARLREGPDAGEK